MNSLDPRKISQVNPDKHYHIASHNTCMAIIICTFIVMMGGMLILILLRLQLDKLAEYGSIATIYIAGMGTPAIMGKMVNTLSQLFKI